MDELAELLPLRKDDAHAQEIAATFDHWTKEPVRLARLWRWLIILNKTPRSPAAFMEHPEVYEREYAGMCELECELNLDGAA